MSGGTYQQLAAATRAERKYYGTSATPANTSAFIKSLSGYASSTVRGTIFTVNAAATFKIYFCCPTHFGAVIFTVDGIVGGFIQRATAIPLTDSLGVLRNYDIYESVNAGLGPTTVTVTPPTTP